MADWELKRMRREARAQARRKADRVTGMLLTVTLAVMLVSVGTVTALREPAPAIPETTVRVQVGEGDTLWELASVYPVDGVRTEDLVGHIAQINGLDGPLIHAGSYLTVPVDTSGMLASR